MFDVRGLRLSATVGSSYGESVIRVVSQQLPLRSTAHPRGPAAAGSLAPVAPFAEASAYAGLWRDLPSSDYGMASKTASQVRFDVENRGAFT